MRHFGLTTGRAIGGNQPDRSHSRANTTPRDLYPYPEYPLHSDPPEAVEFSSDMFEPGAFGLFFAVLLGPALCAGAAVAGYLLLVS